MNNWIARVGIHTNSFNNSLDIGRKLATSRS